MTPIPPVSPAVHARFRVDAKRSPRGRASIVLRVRAHPVCRAPGGRDRVGAIANSLAHQNTSRVRREVWSRHCSRRPEGVERRRWALRTLTLFSIFPQLARSSVSELETATGWHRPRIAHRGMSQLIGDHPHEIRTHSRCAASSRSSGRTVCRGAGRSQPTDRAGCEGRGPRPRARSSVSPPAAHAKQPWTRSSTFSPTVVDAQLSAAAAPDSDELKPWCRARPRRGRGRVSPCASG